MNVRLLLPAIVILLFTACRRDPYTQVYIENMNAEKRLLEDTLYDLQYDYEKKAAEVERLREKVEELKSDGSLSTHGSPTAADNGAAGREPRDLFPKIPELKPPTIDQGSGQPRNREREDDTPRNNGENGDKQNTETDAPKPPALQLNGSHSQPDAAIPSDQKVTRLYLNPTLTGGLQHDEQPGDDGIVLVMEPRNKNSEFVPMAGPVSVMLLEPDSGKRVAQWEFTKQQTSAALQAARAGHGIRLEMPWKNSPPDRNHLHVHVRYWLPNGKTVQADGEIDINPIGQIAARWTPRTEQDTPPANQQLEVAENYDPTSAESSRTEEQRRPEDNWETSQRSEDEMPPARQAGLPQWRPYR